ncbi:MAG: hypothetical protein AAF682_16855 [Planctomycetota bacterium]
MHRSSTPVRAPLLALLSAVLLTASPAGQEQIAGLYPDKANASDRAGFSVGLRDTRAVLGAPYADDVGTDAGALHVFKSSGDNWFYADEITANDGVGGDQLGYSVANAGINVAAGAPFATVSGFPDAGRVYVFTEAIGGYVQIKVEPNDPQSFAGFGWSVAYDGARLVVGAPFADSQGAVYVFEPGTFGWVQVDKIVSPGPDFGRFGSSVSLDGDRIAVGAPWADIGAAAEAGSAYVFNDTPLGFLWTGVELTAPFPEAGAHFGWSVALSGTEVLAGSPFATVAGIGITGAADVFTPLPPFGFLTHQERLTGTAQGAGEELGWSVAFEDGWAVVGAPGHDGSAGSGGAAYVFSRETGGWVERCLLEADETTQVLGAAVALDGKLAVVGDQLADSVFPDVGAAFVFKTDSVQGYGCTDLNPAGSLVELGGAPVVGQVWQLGVDNPLGTQLPGSQAFVGVSQVPPPGFPCGTAVPGWGMGGPGAEGELLLATAPQPVQLGPSTWDGVSPAAVALPLPDDSAFVGVTLYAQGLLIGAAGSAVDVGLTEALSACLGVDVP